MTRRRILERVGLVQKRSPWRVPLAAVAAIAIAVSAAVVGVATPAMADTVAAYNWAELKAALSEGSGPRTVNLRADVTAPMVAGTSSQLAEHLTVGPGQRTLDLNGFNITIVNTTSRAGGSAPITLGSGRLTITSSAGPTAGLVTLTAPMHCAAIGNCAGGAATGSLQIDSGTFVVTGGRYAPGIGVMKETVPSATFDIRGGKVTAYGGDGAAGIGSGVLNPSNNQGGSQTTGLVSFGGVTMSISGGEVTAYGGTMCSASPRLGGAGIGNGAKGNSISVATSKTARVFAFGGEGGAGIGSGGFGGSLNGTIGGAYVEATGGGYGDRCGGTKNATFGGAGIGSGVGLDGVTTGPTSQGSTGFGSDAQTIIARGGAGGAGIGCGANADWCPLETFYPLGFGGSGDISAYGGENAAGIGGGYDTDEWKKLITFHGSATVRAYGGANGAGIGTGTDGLWSDGRLSIASVKYLYVKAGTNAPVVGHTRNVALSANVAYLANPVGVTLPQKLNSFVQNNVEKGVTWQSTTDGLMIKPRVLSSTEIEFTTQFRVLWATSNGGQLAAGTPSSSTVYTLGDPFPIAPAPVPRPGKTFIGWGGPSATSPHAGTAGEYFTGQLPSNSTPVTFYAIYRESAYQSRPSTFTLTGSARVGSTLGYTESGGTWSPTVSGRAFQWYRDGEPIEGATASTYTLTHADVGARLHLEMLVRSDTVVNTTFSTSQSPQVVGFFTAPQPRVIGTPIVGRVLSVATGSWSPAAAITYQWLRDGVAIPGARFQTYTITSADAGAALSVRVKGVREHVETLEVTSAPTARVLRALSTTTPSIAGAVTAGSTLTVVDGAWSPVPDRRAYQWMRDGVAIEGAESASYTATEADKTHMLTVWVTGEKDGYAAKSVVSAPVTIIGGYAAEGHPEILGEAVVGQTLSVDAGSWSPMPSFAYEWQRNGEPIAGATAATYTLTEADRGRQLRVKLTTTLAGYEQRVVQSANTALVLGSFSSAPQPTVTGRAALGQALRVDTGTWVPTPQRLSTQWLRDGQVIQGATGGTYSVTSDDAGAMISVRVTGALEGYLETTRTATAGTLVRGDFLLTPTPVISGEELVGATLTATAGSWEPEPTQVSYQWYRGGTAISGASGEEYTLTGADHGERISVRVTAGLAGYTWSSVSSRATGPIRDAWAATPVTIEGDLVTSATLTAVLGDWAPDAPAAVAYQWYRGDGVIPGATKPTYRLTAADAGALISVRVTATHPAYVTATPMVTATAPVMLSFDTAATPTISGTPVVGGVLTISGESWDPAPSSVVRQWLRDGEPIEGAADVSYTLTAADADAVISARVTAAHEGRAPSTRTTPVVGPVLRAWAAIGDVALTVATVDQPVSVELAGWDPQPETVAVQWRIAGQNVPGATSPTYTPTVDDIGAELSAVVTIARAGYSTVTRTSAAATVGKYRFDSVPTVVPVVSSDESVVTGTTLTADIATTAWVPNADSLEYQWLRDGAPIPGATLSSYAVAATDGGAAISLQVTARRIDTNSSTVLSEAFVPSKSDFESVPTTVTVLGLTEDRTVPVGGTVSVAEFVTTPVANAVRYEWRADGEVLATTSEPRWTVGADALDAVLSVRVVVSSQGYNDAGILGDAEFSATIANFVQVAAPSITGDAGVGSTLAALSGTWTPAPEGYTYQWFRSVDQGEPVAIDGATSAQYTVTSDDLGAQLSSTVTVSKPGYHAETRTTAPTQTVLAGFASRPLSLPVSGVWSVGSSVSVDLGQLVWDPVPSSVVVQWFTVAGGVESPIDGATGSSLVLSAELLDRDVMVRVTPVLSGYVGGAVSSLSSTVQVGTIQVAGGVSVDGAVQFGAQASAVFPVASPVVEPVVEWKSGDTVLGTGATFSPSAAQVGQVVKVFVTYALPGFTPVVLSSDEVTVAAAQFTPGTVTVTPAVAKPVVGTVLSSGLGVWVPSLGDGEVTYQWLRGGTAIAGATGATYSVVAEDLGQPVSVRVSVVRDGYAPVSVSSGVVTPQFTFTAKQKVAISGTAQVGKSLTAKLSGAWAPTVKPTLAYQWYRGTAKIAGATKSSYKLVAADAGKQITVRVTAKAANTVDATVTSAAVKALGVFKTAPVPKITGTLKVGQTLKVTPGTWSPKATFSYQWYRGTAKIAGATKASYKLVAADAGKAIKVVVTGKATNTVTTSKTSATTKTISK